MMGAMARYISNYHQYFVPMNANFGLFDAIEGHKQARKQAYYDRSMKALKSYITGGI